MEETIEQEQLFSIAPRQVSIFDCCRYVGPETVLEEYAADSLSKIAKADLVRSRFDARIMKSIPQEIVLYACSVGQYSYDTPKGAIYLQNLLWAASALSADENVKTVGRAHSEASAATMATTRGQTPEAILPKCLSNQQLILSIRA
jgi:hypothetical protein